MGAAVLIGALVALGTVGAVAALIALLLGDRILVGVFTGGGFVVVEGLQAAGVGWIRFAAWLAAIAAAFAVRARRKARAAEAPAGATPTSTDWQATASSYPDGDPDNGGALWTVPPPSSPAPPGPTAAMPPWAGEPGGAEEPQDRRTNRRSSRGRPRLPAIGRRRYRGRRRRG